MSQVMGYTRCTFVKFETVVFALTCFFAVAYALRIRAKSARAQLVHDHLDKIKPQQIHISYGEKSTDRIIVWASDSTSPSYVRFGGLVGKLRTVRSTVAVWNSSDYSGTRAWHRAYLEDLTGSRVSFQIINQQGTAISEPIFLRVRNNASPTTFTAMVFGDLGLAAVSLQFLIHEARDGDYECLIHVGDIAYDLHRDGGLTGDKFLNTIQTMVASKPYMTCPGDHEAAGEFLQYRFRFSMPGSLWPTPLDQLWYSFDEGPVHFVSINTEVFFSAKHQQKTQLDWLKNNLRNANGQRDTHPWVIVFGHRPMYCSPSQRKDAECSLKESVVRKQLEDIFFEEGVDLYISGHQHNYERTWPVYREKVLALNYKHPQATVHVVIGSMGVPYMVDFIAEQGGAWSAFRLADKKKELFGKLQVFNATHLFWQTLAAANNQQMDRFWIIQRRHGSFGQAGDQAFQQAEVKRNLPPMEPPIPGLYRVSEGNRQSEFYSNVVYYALGSFVTTVIFLLLCLVSRQWRRRCLQG